MELQAVLVEKSKAQITLKYYKFKGINYEKIRKYLQRYNTYQHN